MKIKNVLILIILVLNSIVALGQNIYREGYIIKNNGDTLNGVIRFSENQKIDNKCVFKRFDIATTIEYSSEDLKAFGYRNGSHFEVKLIENKKTFVECLINGRLSLFVFKNDFYLDKQDHEMTLLKANSIKSKNNEFSNLRDYLMVITNDISGFQIPSNVKLNEKELLAIVKDYNSSSGNRYIVYNRVYSKGLFNEATMLTGINMKSFGVVSVFSRSKTVLITEQYAYYSKTPDKRYNTNTWSIGVYYNAKVSRINRGFSRQVELIFSKQNYYFFKESKPSAPNEFHRLDIYRDLTSFKIPLILQYEISIKKFSPFLNLGLSYGFLLFNNKKANLETESLSHTVYSYESHNFIKKYNVHSFKGIIGCGIKYKVLGNKILSLEVRAELGKGDTNSLVYNYTSTPKIKIQQESIQYAFVLAIGL